MAIVFPNGTQSAPVLATRQFVRNTPTQTSYSSNSWTPVANLEGNITPTSSSSYIRVKFILPVAGGTSANSTVRIARRFSGGGWGEADSVVQANYASRPRGHHMSIFHTGSNWSNNWNIAIDFIDYPNTTSTVYYRPEMITTSNGTNYWGVNQPNSSGNDYAAAPCICILEDIDSNFIGTYDGQSS
jgi:hypothetical protein